MVQTFYPPTGTYLAQCPFCGNTPTVNREEPWFRSIIFKIKCSLPSCGISVQSDISAIEAYRKWNQRVPQIPTEQKFFKGY